MMDSNGNGDGDGRTKITVFMEKHRGRLWAVVLLDSRAKKNGKVSKIRKYVSALRNKNGSPRFTFKPDHIHSVYADTEEQFGSLVGIVFPHQRWDVSIEELENER